MQRTRIGDSPIRVFLRLSCALGAANGLGLTQAATNSGLALLQCLDEDS